MYAQVKRMQSMGGAVNAHTEPKWVIADETPYPLGWCTCYFMSVALYVL